MGYARALITPLFTQWLVIAFRSTSTTIATSHIWILMESIVYTKIHTLAAKLLLIINLNPASVIALVSEHVPPPTFAPPLVSGAPILTIVGPWRVLDACILY